MTKRLLGVVRLRVLLWYLRRSPIHYKKGDLFTRVVEPRLLCHGPRFARAWFGSLFHIDPTDMIQRYIYAFGIWEPAVTALVWRRLRPGDAFIDVGAHIGYYTLLASARVGPTGRVVSVEASPSTFRKLERNVSLNRPANVRLVHVAASDSAGTIDVFTGRAGNTGTTTVLPSRGFDKEAQVRRDSLRSILTGDEIRLARIIKIDVEGHEMAVLNGLLPLLGITRADLEIFMEVSAAELATQGISGDALVRCLEQRGFYAYVVDNRYDPRVYAERRHRDGATRLRGPVMGRQDLLFSRINAVCLK